ncbi:Rrf2 family transcriptional regulator [Psychroserpens sp.]|uniref:RrF2 family transcriptional regulator n=1 Tax=Psychroserpens sp. TaxID=2020870 RepID=UPI001AFD1EEC|nr:Rrf2 family transcriptional regulator [Psychroserpens sp.]MBO6607389.1 Rrf2 family transcriptional regulator [Psychroserpens sp.]MBO6631639.1 Rrf2 family transcriptional regulator [Psychroserpens sp.]MBO6654533.1 Rrf2 family transcriptional regulator [Psychroserpens sp.]MBO6681118.1 Rrf2 family transcriptional regulator [Psychroserpens sp.]MBO6749925.1 Rrf2 family transcriptional regulator [Psychroserpens sp.]
MFSNTVKYAIKASLYLAVNSSEDNKLVIKDIAAPINVPQAYIGKILQSLSRKNLISSTRGPKGGFYLKEQQYQTKIMDIVEAVDGEERINSCLLSLDKCNSENPCSLHHLVYTEKNAINLKLKQTTLEDLKNHIMQGKSVLPL